MHACNLIFCASSCFSLHAFYFRFIFFCFVFPFRFDSRYFSILITLSIVKKHSKTPVFKSNYTFLRKYSTINFDGSPFEIIVLKLFYSNFRTVILLFHNNLWPNAPVFIHFLLPKCNPLHLGTFVNFVTMRQFKVCLSVCLIFLGYESLKIDRFSWSSS